MLARLPSLDYHISAKSGDRPRITLVSHLHKPILEPMNRIDRASFFSPQAGRLIDAPRHSHARFGIGVGFGVGF